MKPFNQFIISNYSWDPESLTASFYYSFDNEEQFVEKIDFSPLKNAENFPILRNNEDEISQILAHLHIALWVSYYKLYPTKEIVVESSYLTEKQKNFWNIFYLKGLGEFFYRNQLDPRGLAVFQSQENAPRFNTKISLKAEKSLVLFGGWKDSLVTVELLKQQGKDFDLFSFWKEFPLHEVAAEPTHKKRLIIKRSLDLEQIKKLLEQGYYNWHLPITGIISFVTIMASYLYWYKAAVTSLEKSADEWNTVYCDMEINHQWSKSSEFEKLFKEYVVENISNDFSIYSLLRNWYEIKVVKEFSKYPQYFYSFSSCNRNFHLTGSKLTWDDLWCWVCPKCWFVYTMLRAFLWKEKVNDIFNKDLFEDENLIPLFNELLGIDWIKPFECVGTNEEMVLAFWLILQNEPNCNSKIMDIYKEKIVSKMKVEDFKALRTKLDV